MYGWCGGRNLAVAEKRERQSEISVGIFLKKGSDFVQDRQQSNLKKSQL